MKEPSVTDKISSLLSNQKVVQDKKKLDHQQKYYQTLTKKGVAKKETYSLKPLSMI